MMVHYYSRHLNQLEKINNMELLIGTPIALATILIITILYAVIIGQ
jgi:hypothetical protein